jgi:hypothetical protein
MTMINGKLTWSVLDPRRMKDFCGPARGKTKQISTCSSTTQRSGYRCGDLKGRERDHRRPRFALRAPLIALGVLFFLLIQLLRQQAFSIAVQCRPFLVHAEPHVSSTVGIIVQHQHRLTEGLAEKYEQQTGGAQLAI